MPLVGLSVVAANEVTVGAVRSTVVDGAADWLVGPLLAAASMTAPAPRLRVTVPSPGEAELRVTV